MKYSWQAKLFLIYIRIKKPLLFFLFAFTALLVVLDQWQKYKIKTADHTPWTLVTVETGDRFVVSRHDQTKPVKLCGVSASGDEAKDFLQSIIDLGDGSVIFEQAGKEYEAWILIEPGYNIELLKHISTKPDELVEEQIHLNTWIVERGYARYDKHNSQQCYQPENLAWAEKIAKENKLGIWKN